MKQKAGKERAPSALEAAGRAGVAQAGAEKVPR